MKNINVIDMFCGGGGESTGIFEAAKEYDSDISAGFYSIENIADQMICEIQTL